MGIAHRGQGEPGRYRETELELERHDDILHDDEPRIHLADANLPGKIGCQEIGEKTGVFGVPPPP